MTSTGYPAPATARRTARRALTAVAALFLAAPPALGAQAPAISAAFATAPSAAGARPARSVMSSGERSVYDVKYGAMKVGTGVMEVRGIEQVRGRPAWHTVFSLKGGIPLYRVDDRLESWIDVQSFSSLRFHKENNEGRRHRVRTIELYPERNTYRDLRDSVEQPAAEAPLDDASFLYFVRTIPLEVGQRYDFDRYFRPERNPVTLHVLRRERITVPAGTFETIVVRPIIKTKGIFAEGGNAEVWLTDDDRRLVVQLKAKVSFGSITMQMREHQPRG